MPLMHYQNTKSYSMFPIPTLDFFDGLLQQYYHKNARTTLLEQIKVASNIYIIYLYAC